MGCGGSTPAGEDAEQATKAKTNTKSKTKSQGKGKKYEKDAEKNGKDAKKAAADPEKERRVKMRAEMQKKMREESKLAHQLAPYLPWYVLKRCSGSSKVSTSAEYEAFPGVIIFVDISGYTPLSDSLGRLDGMLGVELLARFINEYFESMIDLIRKHGGSVERFAGDALICLFAATSRSKRTDLAILTERATVCALAIQELHGEYVAQVSRHVSGEPDKILKVHIGIGVSTEIKAINVGGLGDNWRRLLFGTVFDEQLLFAVDAARAGQVCISNAGVALLEKSKLIQSKYIVTSPAISRIEGDTGYSQVVEFHPPHTFQQLLDDGLLRAHALPEITLTNSMERAVRGFVDLFVLSRIESGHTKISETRCLSMLFITINNWGAVHRDITSPYGVGFFSIHQLFRSVQGIVYRFEGCIANSLVDEKGCHLIITYGIPQHSDDPLLAIKSALEIQERCGQLSFGVSIAVATGDTYIGTIGSDQRRDYTIMGAAVNLCARLSSKCSDIAAQDHADAGNAPDTLGEQWCMLLCDERTYLQTKKHVDFRTDLEAAKMKGYDEPVKLFQPKALIRGGGRTLHSQQHRGSGGAEQQDGARADERLVVETCRREQLRDLEVVRDEVLNPTDPTKPRIRPVLISGERGCGKSYFMRVLLEPVVSGAAPGLILESSTQSGQTAFAAWEPVFTQIFSSPQLGFCNQNPQGRSEMLRDFLKKLFIEIENTPEMMELGYLMWATESFVTLLNPVLGTSFPETRDTQDAGQYVVTTTTVTLLVALLKYFSKRVPLCIWMDMGDAPMDTHSMKVLAKVAEDRTSTQSGILLLLLLCCRNEGGDAPAQSPSTKDPNRALSKLKLGVNTVNVELPSLEMDTTMELVRLVINQKVEMSVDDSAREVSIISEIDPDLASYVYKSSQNGKLFLIMAITEAFTTELLHNEKTSLCITNKRLHLRDSTGSFKLKLPDSVTHFATSLVDRLPPTQQLILQCASVEGVKFSLGALMTVFPLQKSQGAMLGELLQLVDKRVLAEVSDTSGVSETYRFLDIVVRDAAYSMVLKDEQERMHKRLAEYWDGIMMEAVETQEKDDDGGDSPMVTPNAPPDSTAADDPKNVQVLNQYVGAVSKHWTTAVLLGKESRTVDELDRAIWSARKYADVLMAKRDYIAAYDVLRTLVEHLYPLAKNRYKAAGNPIDSIVEHEMETMELYTMPMWYERDQFSMTQVLRTLESVKALDYAALPKESLEMKHRALCQLAVEHARIERFDVSREMLDAAAEVAGEVNAAHVDALHGYTRAIVMQMSLSGPPGELVALCAELHEKIAADDGALLNEIARPAYVQYFTGLTAASPLADLHMAGAMGKLLLLNHDGPHDFTHLIPSNDGDVNFMLNANMPRASMLLCLDAALRKNTSALATTAGAARDEAVGAGDTLSVMAADFFIAVAKGAPDEAVPELRALSNALGSLAPLKAVLLEAVVDSGHKVKQYIEFFLRPPHLQGVFAPEILRLQAVLLVRAASECLGKAATLLRGATRAAKKSQGESQNHHADDRLIGGGSATRSAASITGIFKLAGAAMQTSDADGLTKEDLRRPDVLMSEILHAAEARFIASVVLARKGGTKLFLVKALSSLVDFWGDTGLRPNDPTALSALSHLLDTCGGQAAPFASPAALDLVDAYTVQHGCVAELPELSFVPHDLAQWRSYASTTPRLPGLASMGSVGSFGSSN